MSTATENKETKGTKEQSQQPPPPPKDEKPLEGSVLDKAEKEFQEDPFQKRMLADMGLLLGKDGSLQKAGTPAQPKEEPREQPNNFSFTTFGEAVRNKEEAKKLEEERKKQNGTADETKTTEPTADDKTKNPETDKKAETPAEQPKKKVAVKPPERPLEEIVQETVTKALQSHSPAPRETKPKAESQAPAAEGKDKDDFESTLTPTERRELDLWRFAAKQNPDKYKDAPKQWMDFYRKVDAYVRKASQEDPNRTLDDSDEEFRKFIQANRPQFTQVERDDVREAMLEDRITTKVKSDYEKQIEASNRKVREIEFRPALEKTLQNFDSHTLTRMGGIKDSIVAEVAAKISEAGADEARKEFRLEAPIVEQEWKRARGLANEYVLLKSGFKQLDMKDAKHAELVDFIVRQGEIFAAEGGDARVRVTDTGRKQTFLPNHQYNDVLERHPEQANNHWTFSDSDILDILAVDATVRAKDAIAAKEKELEDAGYTRQKKGKATKPENKAPEPKPTDNPKITTTPAPGAATGAATAALGGVMSHQELKALGLPVKTG